jgi:dephospho-CoA kinase
MLIVGITGTLGAGKGTIVECLTARHGFRHYSVRGFLTEIIESRGLPVDRDAMVSVANELRARHSPSYLVEQLYRRAASAGEDCVIESIRTPGEVQALRERGGFVLLAVDASLETRFERIRRRSSSTDKVSFERFVADEAREMGSTDPCHQNIARCIELADFRLRNDGTVEDLAAAVEGILQEMKRGIRRNAAG